MRRRVVVGVIAFGPLLLGLLLEIARDREVRWIEMLKPAAVAGPGIVIAWALFHRFRSGSST